jgi:acetyl esterase/lipase
MLLKGPLSSCENGFARYGELLAAKYKFPPPDPSVQTEERTMTDGLKVRIYMPKEYSGGGVVGVYFHGGGWAMGDLDGDDAIVRSISKGGNVVVVSVEYGLAPQNKHPGLINDCWKALQWTLEHARELGGVDGKVFTAGASAGAGLALGVALKAIDEGLGDSVVGVVALVPATVHPQAVPEDLKSKYTAYAEHDQHTVNTANAMETFWGMSKHYRNVSHDYRADRLQTHLVHHQTTRMPRHYCTLKSRSLRKCISPLLDMIRLETTGSCSSKNLTTTSKYRRKCENPPKNADNTQSA